jgi:hypothetical protein
MPQKRQANEPGATPRTCAILEFDRRRVPGERTANGLVSVLNAFASGPAAARYPARDNLAAMHEWPGEPVAANHNLWPPVVR